MRDAEPAGEPQRREGGVDAVAEDVEQARLLPHRGEEQVAPRLPGGRRDELHRHAQVGAGGLGEQRRGCSRRPARRRRTAPAGRGGASTAISFIDSPLMRPGWSSTISVRAARARRGRWRRGSIRTTFSAGRPSRGRIGASARSRKWLDVGCGLRRLARDQRERRRRPHVQHERPGVVGRQRVLRRRRSSPRRPASPAAASTTVAAQRGPHARRAVAADAQRRAADVDLHLHVARRRGVVADVHLEPASRGSARRAPAARPAGSPGSPACPSARADSNWISVSFGSGEKSAAAQLARWKSLMTTSSFRASFGARPSISPARSSAALQVRASPAAAWPRRGPPGSRRSCSTGSGTPRAASRRRRSGSPAARASSARCFAAAGRAALERGDAVRHGGHALAAVEDDDAAPPRPARRPRAAWPRSAAGRTPTPAAPRPAPGAAGRSSPAAGAAPAAAAPLRARTAASTAAPSPAAAG